MSNILRQLHVNVACAQCGDFAVDAEVIAESQRLLARGCPGSVYECPPQLLASLLDPAALEGLERAWDALERAARDPAREVAIASPLDIVVRRDAELSARAIARWEDDGGHVNPTPRNEPC